MTKVSISTPPHFMLRVINNNPREFESAGGNMGGGSGKRPSNFKRAPPFAVGERRKHGDGSVDGHGDSVKLDH